MDVLLKLDEQVFLFLNGLHAPWLDATMALLTKTLAWFPLYIVLFVLILKKFKKNSWIILLGLTATIVLADQITSAFMKPFFERLRPSHTQSLATLIHIVNGEKGGLYGFASSHAANTFGVAMFVWLALRGIYKSSWLIFLWAAFMSYSRIYLGLHYPSDILAGGLIGILLGLIFFKLCEFIIYKKAHRSLTQ